MRFLLCSVIRGRRRSTATFRIPWLIRDEMGRFVEWIAGIRNRNRLHDFDMTWRTREGHSLSMSLSTTMLRNSMGEAIGIINIARDISDRVRMRRRSGAPPPANRDHQPDYRNDQPDDGFRRNLRRHRPEIRAIVSADMVSIGVLSPDRNSLRVHAITGHQTFWKDTLIPLDRSISQQAIPRWNRLL